MATTIRQVLRRIAADIPEARPPIVALLRRHATCACGDEVLAGDLDEMFAGRAYTPPKGPSSQENKGYGGSYSTVPDGNWKPKKNPKCYYETGDEKDRCYVTTNGGPGGQKKPDTGSASNKEQYNRQYDQQRWKGERKAFRGPDATGRGWMQKSNPTRWLWTDRDTNVNFTVFEKPGPGVPIYKLRVLTDNGMFEHVKPFQWTDPKGAFAAAAQWFKPLAGEGFIGVDMTTNWKKVASASRLAQLRAQRQAGCEKMPEGPLRDNCEKKSEGKEGATRLAELRALRAAGADKMLDEVLKELGYPASAKKKLRIDGDDLEIVDPHGINETLLRAFKNKSKMKKWIADNVPKR